MRNGRRLAIKLLNAARFVLGVSSAEAAAYPITEAIDRAFLAELAATVDEATKAFDAYNYHQALARAETFFWRFTDSYVELVKTRAYGNGSSAPSAAAALSTGLSTLLRLFAPFLPFVAEEVWSWWQDGSIHRAPWPAADALAESAAGGDPAVLDMAAAVLSEIHKAKTAEQRSLRTEVARVEVADDDAQLAALKLAAEDVRQAGRVSELLMRSAPEREVTVELAAEPSSA